MHTHTDACTHSNHGVWPQEGGCNIHTQPDRNRSTHVWTQLCKGDGAVIGSQMDMHTCTDACTHSNKLWDQMKDDWDKHTGPNRKYVSACSCGKAVEQIWKSGVHAYMYWCMYTFWARCRTRKGVTGTCTRGHPWGAHLYAQQYKGEGTDMVSVMDMDTHSDVYTHFNPGVWPDKGWVGHTHGTTKGSTCLHTTMQRGWSRCGSWVHMHTCTLYNQCMEQQEGYQAYAYWEVHVCTQLWNGGGTDRVSQVDMHICTDAFTHLNQGLGPDEGLLGHAYGATEGRICLHATMQSSWEDKWSQVDMPTCTDACAHSSQCVGPDEGWLGNACWTTQRNKCLYRNMQRGDHMWGARWTCAHVLMHVHILTKIWDCKRGVWHMHEGPERRAHACTQLCKGLD